MLTLGTALAAAGSEVAPGQEPPFKGRIDADRAKSIAYWPKPAEANPGAPNILVVLLDDAGFGASSTFGGPAQTPELDRLAAGGLRYNAFHVNAVCSPTRASLLTGRTDHQVGFGQVVEASTGFPGYNSIWPKSTASVAKILKENGYSTAAFGKWHNTPIGETGPTGPFDRWPTGLGFEYFYGFMAGWDNQWEPRLYRGTTPVEPPAKPEQGYHLTIDLVDDAIRWLRQHDAVAPQKPFFMYFATGATHSPHQVPKEWIAKYKGKFDQGWDRLREETFARQKALGVIPTNAELTPRPDELPAWESLSADERALLARQMEVYAAFLEQTDHEVGRLLHALQEEGKVDDTLVFYIAGDNGGTPEGGLEGHDVLTPDGKNASVSERLQQIEYLGSDLYDNVYAAGWAWASSTPFQWMKQVASHLGGTRDPLIVSWPRHIPDEGGLRGQFQHVTDIAPTIYEVAGIQFPDAVDGVKQLPLEGKSFAASFAHSDAPSTHHVQVFESMGNRGIYKDGWWAGARHLVPWEFWAKSNTAEIGQHPWELYNLAEDYSQAHDLAAQNPGKLKEMVTLFDKEAKRTNIYPLVPKREAQPLPADGRTSFVYRTGVERIPSQIGPKLNGRSHTVTADVVMPVDTASGVIIADGGHSGGFTLYIKDGRVTYETNARGNSTGKVTAPEPLSVGTHHIVVDVIATSPAKPGNRLFPGKVSLSVDGAAPSEGEIANLVLAYNGNLDIGKNLGTPVSTAYASPFPFTGTIETVTIDLK
ncbi:arylsulfatase [Telmatospirillum sp.]|uniref:arylsulfatase n=1 Tax=Telmatospirillum sp. TaxID=2079197 RepID=UPI00283C82AB|nr:arylsulfatase [Telmatospirillum sp.]MDR3437394.1 arylsulfatase [Telmatospirillum sp.]